MGHRWEVAALAFVPPAFVRVAWQGIQQVAPDDDERVDTSVDYFDQTWINGRFPIQIWNHHNIEGARTNNHAEGWHAKINRVAGKPHPNIFEVIELFKREQASVEVKIAQLEAGGRAPPRKRVCIRMDQRLKEMKTRLENGECSLAEYVSAVGHFTGL